VTPEKRRSTAASDPDSEIAVIKSRLAAREAEVSLLNAELAETNKGVVALYAELDEKAAQLREASELKSRFLSYMSHEFRTPLGSIRSIARILLDELDGPLLPEQRRQVEFIQGSAGELTDMVNDLLDLARVEAGRIRVSPAWFEMLDLFAALRGMFKPIVQNEAVRLIFHEPEDVGRLYTDDKKVAQILRNFISNALKFTHRGDVQVRARRDGPDFVLFSVSDTGIGIAPEYLSAIFNDYVQLDSPVQRKLRGTGLGLALSRRFAEILGGSVSVESEVGVGSTFYVRLPVHFQGPPGDSSVGEDRRQEPHAS
jgi:signal transduction histidine kinase